MTPPDNDLYVNQVRGNEATVAAVGKDVTEFIIGDVVEIDPATILSVENSPGVFSLPANKVLDVIDYAPAGDDDFDDDDDYDDDYDYDEDEDFDDFDDEEDDL